MRPHHRRSFVSTLTGRSHEARSSSASLSFIYDQALWAIAAPQAFQSRQAPTEERLHWRQRDKNDLSCFISTLMPYVGMGILPCCLHDGCGRLFDDSRKANGA